MDKRKLLGLALLIIGIIGFIVGIFTPELVVVLGPVPFVAGISLLTSAKSELQ